MKALVIAEKAQLKNTIEDFIKKNGFKDDLHCIALHGHICGIKEPQEMNSEWEKWRIDTLPMIPQKFEYKVNDQQLFDRIKRELKDNHYDYIINFTDPEREGQHIFYSVYNQLNCKLPVKRLWAKDLTTKKFAKALNEMEDDLNTPFYKNLTKAAFLRAYADWIVGMNCTRAISIRNNLVIRSGRVVTPVLSMLVQRELEIQNFTSATSYDCIANFGPTPFTGQYVSPDDKQGSAFETKAEAEKLIKSLPTTGKIKSIEKDNVSDYSPTLYSTATLQVDANQIYGYTLKQTADVLQFFWDNKILTYPRTGSSYITKDMALELMDNLQSIYEVPELKKYVEKISQQDIINLSKNKKYVDDSKVSAHTAIITTGAKVNYSRLTEQQKNIFFLVARRMVGMFMDPMISEKQVVMVEVGNHLFKSNGSKMVQKGYKILYNYTPSEIELSFLKVNDKVTIDKVTPVERVTKPPKRYTEASIVTAMINAGKTIEDKELSDVLTPDADGNGGIGTPATRESIVSKVLDTYKNKNGEYHLAEKKGKSIIPTEIGIKIIQSLDGSSIVSPRLTAEWEQKLIKVESGTLSDKQFMTEMSNYIQGEIQLLKNIKSINGQKTSGSTVSAIDGITCPHCKGRVLQSAKGYFCENIRAEAKPCPFVLSKSVLDKEISTGMLKQLVQGEKTDPIKMKNPKTKKSFEARLHYNIETSKLDFVFENSPQKGEEIMECPKCKGKLIKLQGKFGPYYTCENKCLMLSETISGHKLTKTDLKKLLQGGEIGPFELTKKDGGSFNASLSLKDDGKINYIFAKK